MTSALLSLALVLTPAPLTAPKETTTWLPAPTSAITAETLSITVDGSLWTPFMDSTTYTSAPTLSSVESLPTTSENIESNPSVTTMVSTLVVPIEAGMNRLFELGATPYQLRVFGCLAWFESRNDPYAVSPTRDYGLWQINRYFHAWRWRGRDIFDPIVNAEVAWDIYRESGWRAWTTHGLCGV